ncbi:hypothetical protein MA16_Dca026937 [Dendrobium catenatum]|uniref:Uncharacterized protein n=1 Tax=Dendrobium catenatum TaxID=906689 RepID=A0A2I0W228_9ASPA|nr:hypothetical protein MA16_Dca026937 [Dendrobium catenatum]
MKNILNKKKKFTEFQTIALNENYSTIIQKKLPQKFKCLGSFTIPMIIRINSMEEIGVFWDLASILCPYPFSKY